MQIIRVTKFNVWDATDWAIPRVFYGGGKTQQSTSSVSIPPEVLAQYSNVNSIANQTAQTPFSQYSTDPNAFVAPLDSTQQAGILGTNQYSNTAQPFYQQAGNLNQGATSTAQGLTQAAGAPVSSQQIQNYESPYNQAVINSTSNLMNQQFQTAQAGQLGNAIQNGAFGGDREAVTAANLQQQQGLAYGQTIAGLENQNYSQALGEANTQQQAGLQAAGQYGSLGQSGANNEANYGAGAQSAGLAGAQGQLTAGQAQQQTEQAGETALYNQFLQQQSYPFQTAQFLANIAEGTGSLSGSTTTSNQPAPFFSDERLKDDIEPIGKTFDGLTIIKFKYKGDKQTHVGLSAQDVEKKHPHAVGLAGGYKTVDYDAATRGAAERGHGGHKRKAGGLVAGDGGPNRACIADGGNRVQFASGGLAPNSAAEGGFLLDPSYLNAQEEAYASAPWGNTGTATGLSPYGGRSHVPPSSGGSHAALAVARPPTGSSQNGLAQMASSVGQLEGLGKVGKSLYNDAKDYVPGLTGGSTAPAPVANQNTPPPASNDASAGQMAMNDSGGLGGFADLGDDAFDTAKRGGLIHRDAGGSTYQDAGDDDSSSGGDVPYDSGTGMKGLGIPDDHPHNTLATAAAPGQSSGSGAAGAIGTVASIAGDVLPFLLKQGGRVGLAGGGAPVDQDSINPGVEELPQPGQTQSEVAPGQVLRQDDPGGAASFLNRNQGLLVPALHGLASMASSNSRYLGSAVLQGLGGAADSYEKTQDDMAQRGLAGTNMGVAGAQTGLLGQEAGKVGAETGLVGAHTGQVKAQTKGIDLQNEQTRQALAAGDIQYDAGGNGIVRMPDGTNLQWGDWASRGFPPTMHQAHTNATPSIPGKINPATPAPPMLPAAGAPQPVANQQPSLLGDAGKAALTQDAGVLRTSINTPSGIALKNQSQATEADLQNKYTAAIKSGATLNQIASAIESMPESGALAGGPLMDMKRALVMKYNDAMTTAGHPEQTIDQNEIGTSIATDKLGGMMSFGTAHGMDQNSLGALMKAGTTNPSASLPKGAAIKVLSGLYADKQQDIDRWNYLNQYKQGAAAAHPGTPNWYLAQNANSAFNSDHDQTQYGTDKQNIENMLSAKTNQGNTILNGVYHNQFSPQQLQQLEARYGNGIFRYFRNN